jgi:hypothetical protein
VKCSDKEGAEEINKDIEAGERSSKHGRQNSSSEDLEEVVRKRTYEGGAQKKRGGTSFQRKGKGRKRQLKDSILK